jgi:hypothetical protein
MKEAIVAATILSLSGCASNHDPLTERAQFVQSTPAATTNTVCFYVADQLNCRSYPALRTVAAVKAEKSRSD